MPTPLKQVSHHRREGIRSIHAHRDHKASVEHREGQGLRDIHAELHHRLGLGDV
jgi:hypothetical protein